MRQRFGSSLQVPDENVYVTGETDAPDFPVTANALQKTLAGPNTPGSFPSHGDIFVASLDGNTGALTYSTYLGGPNADSASDLLADSGTGIYVIAPASLGLPVTNSTFKPVACTYCEAGYAAKIDTSTGALRYATYLPGNSVNAAVDAAGNLYFTGYAGSDFPATPGAYQTSIAAGSDAFAAKLNTGGTALVYATFYSGRSAYQGSQIAADSQGNAWITGSGDPPGTAGSGYFLIKLDSTGSKLLYSTPFLHGTIAIDPSDSLIVNAPGPENLTVSTPGGYLTSGCGFGFLAKLDPNGTVTLARVLNQDGELIGFDASGNAVMNSGSGITSVSLAAGPRAWTTCVFNSASMARPNSVAPGEIVTLIGAGMGPPAGVSFQLDAQARVPMSVGGTRVLFNGVPGPVLYAQEGQVNAIVPFGVVPGTTMTIQAENQGQALPLLNAAVTTTQPDFFTLDGSGRGQALAFNQDGTPNGPSKPAPLGSILTVFVTGLGVTIPPSVEGELATSTAPKPAANAGVILAGPSPAQILYIGPSPGSVSSVTQINLRLPSTLTGNASSFSLLAMPMMVTIDGIYQITQTVTVALRWRAAARSAHHAPVALIGTLPLHARPGFHGDRRKRLPHHRAHVVQAAQFARAHGLHQDVPDRRRLARAGYYPAACAIGDELVEQSIARAATHDVDDLDLPSAQRFQALQHVAIAQGEALQNRARIFRMRRWRLLGRCAAMLRNLARHLAGLQECVRVDGRGKRARLASHPGKLLVGVLIAFQVPRAAALLQ